MQSSDARILRGAVIPTCLVGAAAIVVSLLVAGSKGALGAVIATAVVVAFFSLSALVVSWAAKISPQTMLMAALASYAAKILAVLLLIAGLKRVTIWDPKVFAWTVIVLVLTWIAAEFRVALQVKAYIDEPVKPGRDD
jgi:ATP synthase protein I